MCLVGRQTLLLAVYTNHWASTLAILVTGHFFGIIQHSQRQYSLGLLTQRWPG